jgi:hypothetical protein
MAVEVSENSLTAFHDKQASVYLKEAVKWEKTAAKSALETKTRCEKKASEFRKKAIDSLQSAITASGHVP